MMQRTRMRKPCGGHLRCGSKADIGTRPIIRYSPKPLISALGQKRTFSKLCAMSALPPKADIGGHHFDVRSVPKADIRAADRKQGRHHVQGSVPVPA
jgi:hypothetical protein